MTVNVPLLRKAVEWVEYQDALRQIDREWNQGYWISSPMNNAYYLLHEQGQRSPRMEDVHVLASHCGTAYCVAGYVAQSIDVRYAHSEYVDHLHSSDFAMQQLGLSYDDSERLFHSYNTAEDIRRIAEEIAGERL